MALTFPKLERLSLGSKWGIFGQVAFDNSYPTGGEVFTPALIGLDQFATIWIQDEQGYMFEYDYTNGKVKAFVGGSGTTGSTTATGTNASSNVTGQVLTMNSYTPGGTNGAPVFTGTAPLGSLNYASPAFSGTGQSSAGQVITTTDNQTMTADLCVGMWFVSATHGPYLIASNTNVAGAPAVLTIYGTAPTTDAGTYKILKSLTPVGTVAAPVFTGTPAVLTGTNAAGTAAAQIFTGSGHTHTIGAAAGGEVANTTDLSALTAVEFLAIGL